MMKFGENKEYSIITIFKNIQIYLFKIQNICTMYGKKGLYIPDNILILNNKINI